MAWCPFGTKPLSEPMLYKYLFNRLNQNAKIIFQENAFKNVVSKMLVTLFRRDLIYISLRVLQHNTEMSHYINSGERMIDINIYIWWLLDAPLHLWEIKLFIPHLNIGLLLFKSRPMCSLDPWADELQYIVVVNFDI